MMVGWHLMGRRVPNSVEFLNHSIAGSKPLHEGGLAAGRSTALRTIIFLQLSSGWIVKMKSNRTPLINRLKISSGACYSRCTPLMMAPCPVHSYS